MVSDRRKYRMTVDIEAIFAGPGVSRGDPPNKRWVVDEGAVEQLLHRALVLAEIGANERAYDFRMEAGEQQAAVGLRFHFKTPKRID